MNRNEQTLTDIVVSLYRNGWSIKEIAGYIYRDTSRKAQRRVSALLSKARKRGLIAPVDDRPIAMDVWRPETYPRAPFEMVGSSGPRSFGFMTESEKRWLKISSVISDIAGATGVKEYGTMYLMAQELCMFLAKKYVVNDAAAVGCVLTAVLALAPSNRELINRVLEWLEVF